VKLIMLAASFTFLTPILAGDALLDLMADELKREMAVLSTQEVPAYYLHYAISESWGGGASASFGVLTYANVSERPHRSGTINVRVGDYDLDNSREIRGDRLAGARFRFSGRTSLPFEIDDQAIRMALWQGTNESYRQALEQYTKVRADVAVTVAAEDQSADFSREQSTQYEEPPDTFDVTTFDLKPWEERVKHYSELFLADKAIYGGTASFRFSIGHNRLVTSEGSRLAYNQHTANLIIQAYTKAEDGMELPLYLSYFAFKPEGLPGDEEVLAAVKGMIAKLDALRKAPVVDPYTGPAILSGRAAGVFFHEVFGHRIEGHRQKEEKSGQTFKKMIGKAVLPPEIQVRFDPTLEKFRGFDLIGHYLYDDEGVPARETFVVRDGILESFLLSRKPFEGFPKSNGHGRAMAGFQPVARQSNRIVESKKPMSFDEMRAQLIEACKAQGREFGLLFEDIQGGFTMTGRTLPNAFNVLPVEVYRIYSDGRPDELVRGVDLIGTPLTVFTKVVGCGNDFNVFTGYCGAESGSVPVAAVAPSMFVSQIEVQKKTKSQELPPILLRPDADPKAKIDPEVF